MWEWGQDLPLLEHSSGRGSGPRVAGSLSSKRHQTASGVRRAPASPACHPSSVRDRGRKTEFKSSLGDLADAASEPQKLKAGWGCSPGTENLLARTRGETQS